MEFSPPTNEAENRSVKFGVVFAGGENSIQRQNVGA